MIRLPVAKNEINKPAVRSAIAHIYFESIHPFEEGNGRIGRAISEKALSQGVKRPILLSLSKAIEANKKAYYEVLQTTQRPNEITHWINYFVNMTIDAQGHAEQQIEFVLKKTKFFDYFEGQLNERQLKVIRNMLEERRGKRFCRGYECQKVYINCPYIKSYSHQGFTRPCCEKCFDSIRWRTQYKLQNKSWLG
ncbi:Fic family protein [Yeosuana sp.]|uniref:Fic family protein n=1 Tax=Yeosuana sp. TaxID=2529388 RepID=UPI004055253E